MKRFLTKRFSVFQDNNRLIVVGLYDFIKHINDTIINSGELIVSPQQNNETVSWAVKMNKEQKKLKFLCKMWKFAFYDFKNFILMYLQRYKIILIVFKNRTGQVISGTEIIELWGYRMMLLDNVVFMQQISHQELYDSSTQTQINNITVPPDPAIIYCGPEGRIYGWDKQ